MVDGDDGDDEDDDEDDDEEDDDEEDDEDDDANDRQQSVAHWREGSSCNQARPSLGRSTHHRTRRSPETFHQSKRVVLHF